MKNWKSGLKSWAKMNLYSLTNPKRNQPSTKNDNDTTKQEPCLACVDMTRNRMRVAIQSGCVTKILALQRWLKIDFPPEFQTRQMHSFPIMYNTMGSKVDGLAVRDHFLPKNGLKTAILGEQIRHRLTSEGAGTQIFKGIANFSMCFKKFGTLPSK